MMNDNVKLSSSRFSPMYSFLLLMLLLLNVLICLDGGAGENSTKELDFKGKMKCDDEDEYGGDSGNGGYDDDEIIFPYRCQESRLYFNQEDLVTVAHLYSVSLSFRLAIANMEGAMKSGMDS